MGKKLNKPYKKPRSDWDGDIIPHIVASSQLDKIVVTNLVFYKH